MIQIRTGDLVAVKKEGAYVLFAILSKLIIFGGHWTYVFHGSREDLSIEIEQIVGTGFNAVVDFIVPKREDRVVRISRNNNFSMLVGPELLQQPPQEEELYYRIWRWKDGRRERVEYLHRTQTPSIEERRAPHYACSSADFAWDLGARGWTVELSKWNT